MTARLLCSTGVISREPDFTDHRIMLDRIGSINAPQFELIYYSDWYDHTLQIREDLTQSDVAFPVLHAEKSIGPLLSIPNEQSRDLALHRLRENCEMAVAVDASLVVLHLWGLPDSDSALERNLKALPECVDICESYGVELSIETIPCIKNKPIENIKQALDCEPRISVTLDTEFLAIHEQTELAMEDNLLWRPGIVKHIHIKDYDGYPIDSYQRRRYLHPGEGTIDFENIFTKLHAYQYQGGVSLESSAIDSEGIVDLGKANRSLGIMSLYLKMK